MKPQWGYAAGLLAYMGMAYVSTKVYDVGGKNADMLFYWLSALGLTGSALLYFLQGKWDERKAAKMAQIEALATGGGGGGAAPAPAAGGGEGAGGDIDQLAKDAEAKLAAAKLGQGAGLAGLPVIFLVGDQGSTKTTVLQNSGMEAELLAGQIYQTENMITPTRTANFWFARKAVFVEAGGRLWGDTTAWGKLLKRVAPSKLKSVVGKGGSAPRAALMCVDIERFLQPGASDAMATAARGVQTRLQEISKQFGISFPVYVLFTRCDRVTFFLDFVRNLNNEESTQVFGTTLPMRNWQGGVYAEEETKRLNQMFDELFYSLCDKRIEFLPRENDPQKLPDTYEFPREFRKLRASLVQFLVDVGRPSQISTSPFLRGFYFTGVRPVIVADVAATPLMAARKPSFDPTGGSATRLFSLADVQEPSLPAAGQAGGGRKIPQWVFLSHLFNDVILEDKAAMGASEASTKTSGLQRVLLGLAGALGLLWAIALTVSFFNNRALETEAIEATQQIKSVRLAPAALPSIDDLKRLEALRQKLELLTKWDKNGAPWSYRWGLYTGDDLLPLVRKAYYQSFNNLMFKETQQDRMLSFLRARPSQARPEDDYTYGYHNLRSYLLTTKEWKRTSDDRERDYLGPRLLEYWSERREVDADRRGLAEKQFVFYAGDLRNGNPFSDREDNDGVERARVWLGSFSLVDRAYNAMLDDADKKGKRLNYNRDFNWTSVVVVNNKDIRGAFSKEGWAYMQTLFKNPKLYESEEWVLPEKYKRSKETPADMLAQIKDRYAKDYIERWRAYFKTDTAIPGYANLQDAANKLKLHSESRSPVLYLIGMASQNTAPEPANDPYAQRVRSAFEWAHNVVPPGPTFVGGKNDPYVNGLTSLQGAAEIAARSYKENPRDAAPLQALAMSQQQSVTSARMVGRASRADTEANLDQAILRILEKPTDVPVPKAENPANAAAGALCAQFNVLTNKFPFNPNVQPEVTLGELNELLQPGTGRFWIFYNEHMKDKMVKIGNSYESSGSVPLNPAFVNFFNQVARLSDAIYKGGQEPRLAYSITLNGVDFALDGSQAKSGALTIDAKAARLGAGAQAFVWNGSPAHKVNFSYNDSPAFDRQGMWAIFRFFVDASVSPAGGGYLLVWPVRGGQGNNLIANAKFTVDLGGAPAVFDKRFMSGLRCIAKAVN